MKRLLVCLALIASMGVLPRPAFAQNAQLSGRVIDQSGGVVPGAAIVVLNEQTGTRRATDTNDEGRYAVPSLSPGVYKVSVQIDGFRTLVRTGVRLDVAQNARLDFTLEAAPAQEMVTVAADASRVNSSDASVGTVINRQFVENLPMNGRSFQSLMLLTPGVVTNTPQSSAAVGYSGEISVNGQRTEANRFTVDGVSANNGTYVFGYATAGTGGGLPSGTTMGTTQSLVSLDALEEFRVLSSTYSAEYGRSPGGQFSFITRSGTNAWHGSVFNYMRHDALDANDWFNNRLGLAKPKQRQNDFGGTIGGPVMIPSLYDGRNRSFFFFSYEGLRVQQPLAATTLYVPSLALREQAPEALRAPLNAYPRPNGADLPNGLSEYILTDSLPSNLDSTSLRLDHNIASGLRLFFRYSDTPSNTRTRSTTLTERTFAPKSFTFGAISPVSNRLNNEFRVGYSPNSGGSRTWMDTLGGAEPVDLHALQGIDLNANPTAYVFVGLYFPGASNGVSSSQNMQRQRQLNVIDTLDFIVGSHQLRFGVDYLRTASDLGRTNPYVYTLFNSREAVLANNSYQASVTLYGQSWPVFENFGAFVQDEWRLTPRLSLSLGLRWDVSPAPGVSRGEMPRLLLGDVSRPETLALSDGNAPMWKTTYGNVAPRVGVAYVLRDRPDHETVLRAGGGVFFDNAQNYSNATYDTSPGIVYSKYYGPSYGSAASFPLTPQQLNVSLSDSLVRPYANLLFQFDEDLALPYTLQWNVSAEQAFGASQMLTLSYVGSHAERLLRTRQFNVSALNRDFGNIQIVENGLTSDYHSLQAQFQRRLSQGLQAMVSYTWAHAIDYGSRNAALAYQRGDSDFDLRHTLSAAATYEVPIRFEHRLLRAVFERWSVDGRFSIRSAFPVSLLGNTLLDAGTGQQYSGGLDLVPGQPLYLEGAEYPGGRRINPAAFALPVGSQIGTAPRNMMRGFGATQVDLTLRREVALSSLFRLQFRVEGFNLFNHPNFGTVNATFGNPQFGLATRLLNSSLGGLSTLYQQGGPRSLQVSARLVF